MRKAEQIIKYIVLFIIVLIGTFFFNILLFFIITVHTNNSSAYFPMNKLAEQLDKGMDGKVVISQEGIALLEKYHRFAMILDGEGRIIWDYQLPRELQKQYSLQDVAVFSKWYLADYPVSCWTVGEDLLVVGAKKDTIWKYKIALTIPTIDMYVKYIPLVGLVDLCIILLLPFFLLRRHNKKLEQERTAWIAGVSHDIRTPLTLVMGYAHELRQGGQEQARELAERIEQESLKIRRLVTDLNTENKMSYGLVEWEKERIYFAAFLREELCDFMNRHVDGKYIFHIEIDEASEQMFILGNKELLHRMIENLLNNATGHNPKGCSIRVQLSCIDKKCCVLCVEDDGCGMPERVLQDICKKSKKNILPERGLGLRLIYRIARFHRFRISYSGAEGKGVSCKIYLKGFRDISGCS